MSRRTSERDFLPALAPYENTYDSPSQRAQPATDNQACSGGRLFDAWRVGIVDLRSEHRERSTQR